MKVDVAVIGAGIHGVGVAQAAAVAGYSVVILEKHAPASGTSSKSSKLIHGGLRYLESGQFHLVRECLHERQLLLDNAPDLVSLKHFYIPLYRDTSRPAWKIRLGLSLYYALSGCHHSGKFHSIPRHQWENLDGLRTSDLQHVYQYWDAQTDDALLTQAVLHSAQSLGTELICPAEVMSCRKQQHEWEIDYLQEEQPRSLRCRVVINAAGPWVNEILQRTQPTLSPYPIELVQGSHIILPEKTAHGIYYVEAPSDRRTIFVMPWKEQTLIGTTEKLFSGRPEDVCATDAEIHYLLETSQTYFPRLAKYTKENITAAFAGLRVLPKGSDIAFKRSRDTIIHTDNNEGSGFITLYGGKLTAYRATAEKVLLHALPLLPRRQVKANTKELKLSVP